MNVTDELREYAAHAVERSDYMAGLTFDLDRIADRIDAEHQKALDERDSERFDALMDAREKGVSAVLKEPGGFGLVELPKDADGEPIHVGDKVTCARSVWQVTGLRLTGLAWGVCCTIFNDHGGSGTNVYPPCDLRHYHAPTVEDVLTEFGIDWEHESDCEDRAALLKEYAKRLTLAEGEDA